MNTPGFLLPFVVLLTACGAARLPVSPAPAAPPASPFSGTLGEYWYQGKAEISTYDLRQARYGELRDGSVVLIQVTEDFLTDKQVKNDRYENPNSVPVIKTNLLRRFTTGVYDYSVMSSVFTPTGDGARTQKVTTSVQDWCGQTFTQLNYAGQEAYEMELRSYFETEGDQDDYVHADFLEDELFNRLRIAGALPLGEFEIVPATAYLLMMHQPYAAARATISGGEVNDDRRTYTIDYPALERQLRVTCEVAAPYRIVGWEETYPDGGSPLTTTATLRERIVTPYWQQKATADAPLRRQLGLE